MNNLISFLNSNFFQTVAVMLGGAIAFVVYKLQEKAKRRDAAVIICLEIESVMSAINKIKLLALHEDIFQTSSVHQKLYWFEYRSLFVKVIGKDMVDLVNKFYDQVILCEEARGLLQNTVLSSRTSKTVAIQDKIADILMRNAEKNIDYSIKSVDEQRKINSDLQSLLDMYSQLYNNPTPDFISNSVTNRYSNAFINYKDIEPIVYLEIKKLAGIIK